MQAELMRQALAHLDERLRCIGRTDTKILIGGGGAFALAYQVPLQTADIDGVAYKSAITRAELETAVKATAKDLQIAADWLNPYFETFLVCLPSDYGDRLKEVYLGKSLQVLALGMNDLLIMKCFAGREKDLPHAKVLIRKGADVAMAEAHIRSLKAKNFPGAQEALDFLIDAEEQAGGG